MIRFAKDVLLPESHLDEDGDDLAKLVELNDQEEQIVQDMLDEDAQVKEASLLRKALSDNVYDISEIDGHTIYLSQIGFLQWSWKIPDLGLEGTAASGAEAKVAAFRAIGYNPFDQVIS